MNKMPPVTLTSPALRGLEQYLDTLAECCPSLALGILVAEKAYRAGRTRGAK